MTTKLSQLIVIGLLLLISDASFGQADTSFIPMHSDSTNAVLSPSIVRIERLLKLNFVSGTIYFTGAGFTNPVVIDPQRPHSWDAYFSSSRPGTIIIFDRIVYKRDDGTLSRQYNETIKLE